ERPDDGRRSERDGAPPSAAGDRRRRALSGHARRPGRARAAAGVTMRSHRRSVVTGVLALALALTCVPARGQSPSVGDVFRRVAPSVVVIRARGREVGRDGGEVTFTETGSGVLIAPDGKVMTAAHVVHTMDTITVETVGGQSIPARVISSEPAADLS